MKLRPIPKKKTKIICTIGPATESEECLIKLLEQGMNVMRLNFSHGDFAEHQNRVENLKKAVAKTGIPAAVLQDLGGPKIRIGNFKTESVVLKEGQKFTLTTEDVEGDENIVSVNYPTLHEEVFKDHIIYLHDGRKKLKVLEIKGREIITEVLRGGEIKGRRGVNLPNSHLTVSSLTKKDVQDVEFGIANDVDFMALSFVRRPEDVLELREILNKRGCQAGIIAKIETPQAIKNIDGIIDACDAIMIARGDLAIEVPPEDVPLLQKTIINKCNEKGRPVITATQMLESMIKSSVPTRAEVSDVANAILDGTDAIMLSEETTLGDFPIEAVEVMNRVAIRVENDLLHRQLLGYGNDEGKYTVAGESIAVSTVRTAYRIDARLIVSLTGKGYGARMTSRHRGRKPIIVATPNEHTYRKANLYFGCYPVMIKQFKNFDETLAYIKPLILDNGFADKGDKIVVICAIPFGQRRGSNAMIVEEL
jgi:pyruvate kinase